MQSSWGSGCVGDASPRRAVGQVRDVAVEDLVVLEDVKGETVTIGLGSLASDFDEFLPEAQKVVDSVKWGGS
jgi:hypothetical protein